MKKIKALAMLGICGLILAGCGDETATNSEQNVSKESVTEESTNEEKVSVKEVKKEKDDSEVSKSEFGTMTKLGDNIKINETQESGPFIVTVLEAGKGQLQPSSDYVEMLGGEDLAVISIKVRVENTNTDTNTIYADQGTIVTDTKQQVEASMILSDDVGGDFIGEVIKEGTILFMFEGNAKDVKNVKYVVGSGSDSDWSNFGEDLTFNLEFK
ncbi:MAG: hypothetical protein RR439_00880 [Carnobacterium sp.]